MTCTCKEPGTPGVKHRVDGPCFHLSSLPNLLDGTTEFMLRAGQLGEPQFGECDSPLRKLRRELIAEEFVEYLNRGERPNDLVETVDGLLDIIVIAWGTLLAYIGEDKAKVAAAEVVRSNLSKVDGTLGPIRRREDGKILKPENWTPPDIAGALE